ncbi:MAG: ABC transporter substrate-binding protein [Desulfamplus sp.]|nr:ABC transporter substrate-binding protein [Desulfamplus sp.]
MNRRRFIKSAGLGVAAAATMLTGVTPTHAEGKYEWKMVSAFPEKIISGRIAARIAKSIETLSNGRIKIKLYYPGELVKAFDSFDAVSKGEADIGFGASAYWPKQDVFHIFYAVPFGLNYAETASWLIHGGGHELWDELYAQYNVKPFFAGNSGAQMGGWFNKEIKSIDDFKSIRMRIGGLGGKVIQKAGGEPVILPSTEILDAMKSGKVNAAEWANPYEDTLFGLHNVAQFFYWPGWHEPQALQEFIINKKRYDTLPNDLQEVIKHATSSSYIAEVSEYIYLNGDALANLVQKHNVKLRHFPPKVLGGLARYTKEVLTDIAGKDTLSKKIVDSYNSFAAKAVGWSQIGEEGVSQARSQTFSSM